MSSSNLDTGFSVAHYQLLQQKIEQNLDSLEKFSPKDSENWDRRRAKVDDIRDLAMQIACEDMASDKAVFDENGVFLGVSHQRVNFYNRMKRLHNCSGWLKFSKNQTPEGDIKVRLLDTRFCRVRECPVCQWRRSLTWYYRFFNNLSTISERFASHHLLHLTLTVPNCHITELRSTLARMNKAWVKYTNLKKTGCVFKEFKIVKGWVRSVEVAREKKRTDYAHPHFHCLLLVPSSYFSAAYIKREKWLSAWKTAYGDDNITQVFVQKIYAKSSVKELLIDSKGGVELGVFSALPEVIKYGTKSSDFLIDFERDQDDIFDGRTLTNEQWYRAYVEQVRGLRFIATGLGLKNILKGLDGSDAEDVSSEEMIGKTDHEEELKLMETVFHWQGKYLRKKDYEE